MCFTEEVQEQVIMQQQIKSRQPSIILTISFTVFISITDTTRLRARGRDKMGGDCVAGWGLGLWRG